MFQRPVENFHRAFLWNGLGINNRKYLPIPKNQKKIGYMEQKNPFYTQTGGYRAKDMKW